MSLETPIVFVVDDDVSVRESLELLIRSAGWEPETSRVGPGIPGPPATSGPELPDPRCQSSQSQRARPAEACFLRAHRHADHFRDRLWRRADDGEGDEGRRCRVLMKPFSDDALLTAVEQVLERSRTALALDTELQALRDRHASLSPREQELVTLAARLGLGQ
jgi:hypothetical protein